MKKVQHITLGLILLSLLTPMRSAAALDFTPFNDRSPSNRAGAPADPLPPTLSPDVARALDESTDETLHVIVILHTADISSSPASSLPSSEAPARQRAALVSALQEPFEDARRSITPILAEAQARGELLAQRDLWIIHGIALTAQPALIHRLAKASAVSEILLDHYRQYLPPQETTAQSASPPEDAAWGLAQIRAPEVWETLGISGTSAIVAVMDTGTELMHPALLNRYRGNLKDGLFDHSTAWYDAVGDGIYPYDDHGHGTHVAGTAVGEGNIGVAPTAQWISVKVLNGDGHGYDSWIHAGFQWILAPGGNPALAPDVVNASWSTTNGYSTVFEQDIQTLHQAGILPVFASGNEGPYPGTVGSPASLQSVFAVGASDPDDEIVSFSGRGPSPWGEVKPYVAAPGVNIPSSLPGGIYQTKNGTSMATPHVAGLIALMRSVSPTLPITTMTHIITSTAVPLSTTLPNNDSGWGRVDAFAAMVALTHPGLIGGVVRSRGQTDGIPNAIVQATPRGPVGRAAQTRANSRGDYTLALSPGTYDLTASAFGYAAQTHWLVSAMTDTQQQLNFELSPLPMGTLWGRATVTESEEAPAHPVSLYPLNKPVSTTIDASGYYTLSLPAGTYTVEARGLGYRITAEVMTVLPGAITTRHISLTPAPTLLLVDEGAWQYDSQIRYWEAALTELAYTYDAVRIKHPHTDTPISSTLAQYDIVLWSSPRGAPGLVGGAAPLKDYLEQGGRLFLSGQDIAYFDGGGSTLYPMHPYLNQTMSVRYQNDTAPTFHLSGLGPFAGMTLTLNGPETANNQNSSDEVSVADVHKASPLWKYDDNQGGGVGASICVPYRSLFFSFGYEAISGAETRREVLRRSLDWLMEPPRTSGLALSRLSDPTLIGLPGQTLTHTLRLRHTGYAGQPEAAAITLDGNRWATTVTPTMALLTPCEWTTLIVTVTIPTEAGVNAHDTLTLTIKSSQTHEAATATLQTKTPAPILLVDDDRWYPMEAYYTSALAARQFPFDIWDTRHSQSGPIGATSPETHVLHRYPIVIWFTGYDWYGPILPNEEMRLLEYLHQGGRLLLSSQDFLYYHAEGPLAQRLGVLNWNEGQQPTTAAGVPDHPAGGGWGPVALSVPFKNWADVVEPIPDAAPVARGQEGQPIAIAHQTHDTSNSKSLFYAFPLETLPDEARAMALEQSIGWLSPLGNSTWTIRPVTPLPPATPVMPIVDQYMLNTLVLHNDALISLPVAITHDLSPTLALITDTALLSHTLNLDPWASGLNYSPASQALTWTGTITPGTPITFTWVVSATGSAGDTITPTMTFALPTLDIAFQRQAQVRLQGSDLGASTWLSAEWSTLRAGMPVTLAFQLHNTGVLSSGAKAGLWLMNGLAPLTATLPPTRGLGLARWEGNLMPGAAYTLTLPVIPWAWETPLRIDALLEDDSGQRWEKRLWLTIAPWNTYLPLVLRNS